mmetsp:Transcript_19350/g.73104  ORF Transcript_19350/g.73104 Transcript_19350/m.73104 type:complete len:367 (+) Transcript_19350:682-1782(+)|eukprot:scaffold869_cov303-Pinguiococcus_pyrenoidosus.AAC.8
MDLLHKVIPDAAIRCRMALALMQRTLSLHFHGQVKSRVLGCEHAFLHSHHLHPCLVDDDGDSGDCPVSTARVRNADSACGERIRETRLLPEEEREGRPLDPHEDAHDTIVQIKARLRHCRGVRVCDSILQGLRRGPCCLRLSMDKLPRGPGHQKNPQLAENKPAEIHRVEVRLERGESAELAGLLHRKGILRNLLVGVGPFEHPSQVLHVEEDGELIAGSPALPISVARSALLRNAFGRRPQNLHVEADVHGTRTESEQLILICSSECFLSCFDLLPLRCGVAEPERSLLLHPRNEDASVTQTKRDIVGGSGGGASALPLDAHVYANAGKDDDGNVLEALQLRLPQDGRAGARVVLPAVHGKTGGV